MSLINIPSKTKMIINAGIRRIVYEDGYADQLSEAMLEESGVVVERFGALP